MNLKNLSFALNDILNWQYRNGINIIFPYFCSAWFLHGHIFECKFVDYTWTRYVYIPVIWRRQKRKLFPERHCFYIMDNYQYSCVIFNICIYVCFTFFCPHSVEDFWFYIYSVASFYSFFFPLRFVIFLYILVVIFFFFLRFLRH